MTEQHNSIFMNFIKWIFITIVIGFITGWLRYWMGYYILIQGVVLGFLVPWLIHKSDKQPQKILSDHSFKITVLLFFSLMIGQALGFGFAQPVFDPLCWFGRTWSGATSESVFGIFSTAGVAHKAFSGGMNGGFWLFLWLFDVAFMFFFMLISLPVKSVKNKS